MPDPLNDVLATIENPVERRKIRERFFATHVELAARQRTIRRLNQALTMWWRRDYPFRERPHADSV